LIILPQSVFARIGPTPLDGVCVERPPIGGGSPFPGVSVDREQRLEAPQVGRLHWLVIVE
jgi:hypothetical protein